jgi:effector-binding domain-containing protein
MTPTTTYEIEIREVTAQPIAAVTQVSLPSEIGKTLIAGLDKVYAVLRLQGVEPLGCNVGLYRDGGDGRVSVCSGVETPHAIEAEGDVAPAATPAGRAAVTTHWGPYEQLGAAHRAIAGWIAAHGLASRLNWEVYGDWADDPGQRRTDVFHLIEEAARP